MKKRCAGTDFFPRSHLGHYEQRCKRIGAFFSEEDGEYYCKKHLPEAIQAKKEKQTYTDQQKLVTAHALFKTLLEVYSSFSLFALHPGDEDECDLCVLKKKIEALLVVAKERGFAK